MSRLKLHRNTLCLLSIIISAGLAFGFANSGAGGLTEEKAETRLTIVWTSGDPEVAHRMVLMYAHAAKTNRWFDEARVIVWGPSSRLLAADKDLQAKIKSMQDDGVIVQACIVCADSYGVTKTLREMGLEVKGMGKPLSDLVKDPGMHVLTF
jgi:hypothetical protein